MDDRSAPIAELGPAVSGESHSSPSLPAACIPAERAVVGQTGVVQRIDLDPPDTAFLRAMGLCVNARVRICRVGDPVVIAVGGTEGGRCRCGGRCRIGLSRRLAEGIWIAPISGGSTIATPT